MLKQAKVLVAGGTSFLGMNLILRLLDEGAQVRATIHRREPLIQDARIDYLNADLRNAEDCALAVEGVDYVFMCAANTSGAAVMNETPLAHVTPNVVMNAQIMEAAYAAKVKKFAFISSSAAYPPTDDRPVTEPEMFEGDPYDVYYSVGWMKRYAEILCKVYAQKLKRPMPTLVVRPSNVYGPYDKFDPATSHVTAALIRRVVERQDPMDIWGTGEDIRDLIYVDDFIDGLLLAFEKSQEFLAVNLASGQGSCVKDVLGALLDIDGFADANVTYDPNKPRTIPVRRVDTTFAEKELGFQARTPLESGLAKTLAWYRENKSRWPK